MDPHDEGDLIGAEILEGVLKALVAGITKVGS